MLEGRKAGCNFHSTTVSLVVQIRRLHPAATAARDVLQYLRVATANVASRAGNQAFPGETCRRSLRPERSSRSYLADAATAKRRLLVAMLLCVSYPAAEAIEGVSWDWGTR